MTAGRSEPAATPGMPGGELIDLAGDLPYTTERLRRRGEELLAEYEKNAKALARVGVGGVAVTGRGSAQDEAVVIEVDSDNRLIDLTLDPRALRLGSIANLRTAIMDAFAQASQDVADQLSRETMGVEGDPVREMLESMPELMAIMPPQMYEEYLDGARGDEADDPLSTTGGAAR
ncbi:MAG: YbaB/EbfC family nucleoid-associated protein [Propionibacteriales bacterium]|nr:YbaB/EbfC family nucleoid-associated protein [Propionibacteriales bacterium]